MREVPRDNHWPDEVNEDVDEIGMAQIALLMRNYDLLLGLLTHFAPDRADEIYALHEEGKHLNPAVFLPTMEPVEDSSEPE